MSAEKVGAGATERPWRVGTYPGDDGITVRDGADMWVCRTIRPSQAAAIVAAVNAYHPERDALLREAVRLLERAQNTSNQYDVAHFIRTSLICLRATQAEPSASLAQESFNSDREEEKP